MMPDTPDANVGGFPMPNDQDMNNMPPADNEDPNQFDTNFDAGVEANEEEDPKKYIQQLTGKLSQSLRNFNDDNGQADPDLSKYVAGMIVKQCIEGLDPKDVKEIKDKLDTDADEQTEDDNTNAAPEPPAEPAPEIPAPDNGEMAESVRTPFTDVADKSEVKDDKKVPASKRETYGSKAYTSPFAKK